MATLAPAEHERRPALSGSDLTRSDVGDGDGVEPLKLPEHGHRRGYELFRADRSVGEARLEQVRDYLRVRFRAEPMTGAHERLAELTVVGDDAVVDEGEPA